jgi:hypothetical protein
VIQLVFFLFIGAALLSSLFLMARRRTRPEGNSQVLVEARQALNSLQTGLLPRNLVARIFAKEDSEYVASLAQKGIVELFTAERKKVAIAWVDQVQAQVLTLKRFHLRAARFYNKLSVRTELEVAWKFAALLTTCRALRVLLYVGGPYAAPRVVGLTASVATRVCEISEQSLTFLNPVQIRPMASNSAGTLGA